MNETNITINGKDVRDMTHQEIEAYFNSIPNKNKVTHYQNDGCPSHTNSQETDLNVSNPKIEEKSRPDTFTNFWCDKCKMALRLHKCPRKFKRELGEKLK